MFADGSPNSVRPGSTKGTAMIWQLKSFKSSFHVPMPLRSCHRSPWIIALVLCCAIVSGVTLHAVTAQDYFNQGVGAYISGNHTQAVVCFQNASKLAPSAGTFHNLGNAEWKSGHTGAAMLAWERAQWLDPFSAGTQANLRFARKSAQLDSPPLTWYEICSTWLPTHWWAWLSAITLWSAIVLIMLPGTFRWRKKDWHQGCAAACFAIFFFTLPALVGIQSRTRLAVVIPSQAPLRLTPTQDAEILTKLVGGEVVRFERERSDYWHIRGANDLAGWVKKTDLGRISHFDCP